MRVAPWGVASFVALVGTGQLAAAIVHCPWARRAAALFAAAIFSEFTVKIFVNEAPAPGSSLDLAVAIGNAILFAWPTL